MSRPAASKNLTLSGTSISPGLAAGKAFVYRDVLEEQLDAVTIRPDQVDAECKRLHRAAEQVLIELKESARRVVDQIGPYHAEIFGVHRTMLEEFLQSRQTRHEMETEHVSVETAVQRVFHRWVQRVQADESTRFVQRADDVADLGRQILRQLMGVAVHPLEKMPEGGVLVAPRLLPSDAVFFARRNAVAVVVELGAPATHCALITRQMGIPGVRGVPDATEKIEAGDVVLVDGFRSTVVVKPDRHTRKSFERRIEQFHLQWKNAKARCRDPAVTADGVRIPVMANVANRADVRVAVENGADGVGLYRLEAVFMLRKSLPTEQELLDEIANTLVPMQHKPAIVRLLDVGSDKDLPYLAFEAEPAPCLGRRGVRLLLAEPQLLKIQLRALLRLSQVRHVQIMVPMITLPEDMQAVRQAAQTEASDLGIHTIPPLVAMIETPAAALCVPEILQFADALSLGTNDLTQYTMAAGRQNPLVHRYFQDDHRAVLRLIRLAASEAGSVLVGVCGELAGQPHAVPMLLDAGVRLLSVAPPLIPTIKEAVRHSPAKRRNRVHEHTVHTQA
ncbi:MAG: phosphoenolpyruvate--protein phosphotransferase [Phycisphaerae bacterium]